MSGRATLNSSKNSKSDIAEEKYDPDVQMKKATLISPSVNDEGKVVGGTPGSGNYVFTGVTPGSK